MSTSPTGPPRDVRETVLDLRGRLGLFSFGSDEQAYKPILSDGACPDLGLRPGGIVEWLTGAPGAGAAACAMRMMSQQILLHGLLVIVDSTGECYTPALAGW